MADILLVPTLENSDAGPKTYKQALQSNEKELVFKRTRANHIGADMMTKPARVAVVGYNNKQFSGNN